MTLSPRSKGPAALLLAAIMAGAGLAACSSTPAAQTGQKAADTDINAGLSAEQASAFGTALKDFQDAAKASPNDAVVYYDLGVIYQQEHNIPLAIGEYQKALLVNSKLTTAMYNLAIIYTSRNPPQAVSLYQQILAINANDVGANFNLGLLLYGKGQKTQAVPLIKKAIQLDPKLASRVPSTVKLTS